MGVFDQFKAASEMMKNMSPEQLQQLQQQAGGMQKMMEDTVRKIVDEEIQKRGLVSRDEVDKMIKNGQ